MLFVKSTNFNMLALENDMVATLALREYFFSTNIELAKFLGCKSMYDFSRAKKPDATFLHNSDGFVENVD